VQEQAQSIVSTSRILGLLSHVISFSTDGSLLEKVDTTRQKARMSASLKSRSHVRHVLFPTRYYRTDDNRVYRNGDLVNRNHYCLQAPLFLGAQLLSSGAREFWFRGDGSKCLSSITTGGKKQLCQSVCPYLERIDYPNHDTH
jgi:hypothetical protein